MHMKIFLFMYYSAFENGIICCMPFSTCVSRMLSPSPKYSLHVFYVVIRRSLSNLYLVCASSWMRSCMVVDEPYNACVLLDALLHGC